MNTNPQSEGCTSLLHHYKEGSTSCDCGVSYRGRPFPDSAVNPKESPVSQSVEGKDISVFISEDSDVSQEIIERYFADGKVTYASLFPKEKRQEITRVLDDIETI